MLRNEIQSWFGLFVENAGYKGYFQTLKAVFTSLALFTKLMQESKEGSSLVG